MRAIFSLLVLLSLSLSGVARDIDFDFVDGYVLLHGAVNAHPVTLLLDSGASASVLSLDTARRLHLPTGKPEGVDGVNANATAYRIGPVTPHLHGCDLAPIALAVDLSNAAQLCSEHIDGLVGADFLRGRITQIDYANHRLRLLASAPSDAESLPLKPRNGIFCLPLSVNGSHTRWTRLDTGCNDALHWVVPRSQPSQQQRGVSIGFITNTQDETLVTVGLGHHTLPNVETALHGSPIFPGEAGLLGSEILSQYCVTIDARANRIYLAPSL